MMKTIGAGWSIASCLISFGSWTEIADARQPGAHFSAEAPPAARLMANTGGSNFVTYEGSETFAIDYPASWQVRSAEGNSLSLVDGAVTPLVTTDVWQLMENTEAVVMRELDTIQTNGSQVEDFTVLDVDGHTALRLWISNTPDAPHAIATYIGYDDNVTVVILSRFQEYSTETDDLIQLVHSSFRQR